jgi:hypothetical protein
LHNKSVAAKSHYAFKSNFWESPHIAGCFLFAKINSTAFFRTFRVK